ncbi:AAA family ATPase [Gardnerella sp. DNF00622A]|uniref:ATP-binding protein n=1 Tax=Gardnerella TaxID=2701 RepID=UPI000E31FD75|nr:ATP-binding protein [Gardnerella vaginalis]RFD76076.1 AAA family ATPase [Gardnerella vaginalis]
MAIREVLANTLIHADYYMRGNTVITYNDAVSTDVDGSSQSSIETDSLNAGFKLSFANPGCLRMPIEVALAGGFSDSRNPALLKMFALISVVERAGSGFDAMRAGCDWAGIPHPRLSESFNPDRTTLEFFVSDKNNIVSSPENHKTNLSVHSSNLVNNTYNSGLTANALSQDSNKSYKRMSVDDCYKKIIEAVNNHGTIKREQVQNILNVGSTKAKQLLSNLVSRGDISVCGKGRATTYVFNH